MPTSLEVLRGQCDSWEHHAIITLCSSALDNQEGFLFHTWISLHCLTNSLKHFESVTHFLKTASAIGDPQILPKYSNSTDLGMCWAIFPRKHNGVNWPHGNVSGAAHAYWECPGLHASPFDFSSTQGEHGALSLRSQASDIERVESSQESQGEVMRESTELGRVLSLSSLSVATSCGVP